MVLIDTAGRLHNKVGLMNELKKIKDVMKKVLPEAPDEVMLVLDGSTGQMRLSRLSSLPQSLTLHPWLSPNLMVLPKVVW